MPYAIKNKRYNKFVHATDFRCFPYRQILTSNNPILYKELEDAQNAMIWRGCGKDYKVVEVKITEVKHD